MSIFDKLKNALFEEEYVEVEEKPKKEKKPSKTKNVFKNSDKEKPVAKKIILPEKREVVISDSNDVEEDIDEKVVDPVEAAMPEFKIMEDEDFKVDEEVYAPQPSPEIVRVIDEDNRVNPNPYQNSTARPAKKPYGIDDALSIPVHEYGAYEKREERGYFKPSPIISPIYGILDKNYRKDDIVTRKDVKLTSSYARERLNVDDVRNKAYGRRSVEEKKEEKKPVEEPTFEITKEEDNNVLVDLTSPEDKPSIKEVTVGDAVEYFQDLGLEYNVDYVDATKNNKATKEVKEEKKIEEKVEPTYKEVKEVKEEKKEVKKVVEKVEPVETPNTEEEDYGDDNLFDLIDSMYRDDE